MPGTTPTALRYTTQTQTGPTYVGPVWYYSKVSIERPTEQLVTVTDCNTSRTEILLNASIGLTLTYYGAAESSAAESLAVGSAAESVAGAVVATGDALSRPSNKIAGTASPDSVVKPASCSTT